MSEIKDSGNRRQFSSGAVRDMAEGKGRMDLLPLDIVSNYLALESQSEFKGLECIKFTECYLFDRMYQFMQTGDVKFIYWILHLFIKHEFGDIETAIMELSCHYEAGARKYAERNWEKGIPCHSFVDSALRHAVKYFRGDQDEPHNRAFMWNLFGLLWMINHKPEMNDLPAFNKESEKDQHQSVLLKEDNSFNRPAPDVKIECKDMSNVKFEEDKILCSMDKELWNLSGDDFDKKHNISSSGLTAVKNPPSLTEKKEEEILLRVKFKIKDNIESVKNIIKECKYDVAGFESGYYITPLNDSYITIRNFNTEVYDNQFSEYFDKLYLFGDPKFTQDNEAILYLKLDNKDSKRLINNLLSIPKEIRKEFLKSITLNNNIFDISEIKFLRYDLISDKSKLLIDDRYLTTFN